MVLIYQLFKPNLYLIFFILLVYGIIEEVDAQTKNIKLNVSYRSKTDEDINVKKHKLNHPIKISEREIINHLVSLKYKGTSIGNKEMGVFFLDEIKKLVPTLVKAFAGVNPKKIIHIELKGKNGITVGDIFSFRNYLNWRFQSINGETFFQKNDARGWNIFAWKLMPQKGQLYYKSSENKRIHKNWLVAKLYLPVSKTRGRSISELSGIVESDNSDKKINKELESKLRHLKGLYDQGLIEKEEYKAQQKNLFRKLF